MVKHRWWAAVAVLAMAGLAASARPRPPPAVDAQRSGHGPVASASAKASSAPAGPAVVRNSYDPSPFPHRTTSGSIARGNLNARIDSLTGWIAHDPNGVEVRKPLVDALLSRTQFFGTFTDFERALALAPAPRRGSSGGELDMWASVQSALHEFTAAQDALKVAERLDGKPRSAALATIHLALGADLPGVLAMRETAAAEAPSFESLSGLAAAQAALGRFDAADATYREALASYRDVSPFPVAWVEFQRGMMWAESAGRPDRAVPLYQEALSRLPGYVVASVHLSELEAEAGQTASAVERLMALADEVEDPEPAAVLAKLLAGSDPERAARYAAVAKRGYERLLAKHRNAFLDHAAEFFMEAGKDPRRALALAEENLRLRPTDRAYLLAIRSARAAGEMRRACGLAELAGDERPSVPLRAARRDVLSSCPSLAGSRN
jgi:tetratricopeptide (TPR) repeat protein